ncbi:hypothetical protein, partial [Listeria monocytogenes]|uniref:hypothetical protein n=1 Tax=Listeria monocytogenes TaxID=1639 RepID=UPI000B05E236
MKTTIASLKCIQCENNFPLNLNVKSSHITCPFCQTEVANDLIEQIYVAANTVGEVNYNFRKYAVEYQKPIFELSVKKMKVGDILEIAGRVVGRIEETTEGT